MKPIFSKEHTQTPRRLPAEWETQDAVLMVWPHSKSDWQKHFAEVIPVFCNIIKAITQHEQLVLICEPSDQTQNSTKNILEQAEVPMQQIRPYFIASNDTWARDFGPITVIENDQALLLDFTFNAWGGKFAASFDNQITSTLYNACAFVAPIQHLDIVLEGGSIESDGQGTILTTSRCLLHPNRNARLAKKDIENMLIQQLGSQRILWLEHGYLAGDDTDAHIDMLARFCAVDTIAYMRCDDSRDEHYAELTAMESELRSFRTLSGQPYNLVPLPWPQACFDREGRRLAASYANFLIVNEAVLVPLYRVPQDKAALATLAQLFPTRKIIGIDCRPIIEQNGSLHCLTMQLPKGVLA